MCRNARIWSSHSELLARPALGDKDKLCSSISKEAWGNKCSKVARVKSRSCCRLKHILQIWGLLGSKFEGVLRRPDSEASPRAALISRFLSNWHCMFYPVACRPGSEPPMQSRGGDDSPLEYSGRAAAGTARSGCSMDSKVGSSGRTDHAAAAAAVSAVDRFLPSPAPNRPLRRPKRMAMGVHPVARRCHGLGGAAWLSRMRPDRPEKQTKPAQIPVGLK